MSAVLRIWILAAGVEILAGVIHRSFSWKGHEPEGIAMDGTKSIPKKDRTQTGILCLFLCLVETPSCINYKNSGITCDYSLNCMHEEPVVVPCAVPCDKYCAAKQFPYKM